MKPLVLLVVAELVVGKKRTNPDLHCSNVPDGFQYDKKHEIYWVYMPVKRSWIEHERFCQTLDPRAHLITIQGLAKNNFAFKRTGHNLAIGLVRLRPNAKDSWINGDNPVRYGYRQWKKDDIGKGSCVFLKRMHPKAYPRGHQGDWHRTSCDIPQFHGMCEIQCMDPPKLKVKLPTAEQSRIMNEIYEDFDKSMYSNMVEYYPSADTVVQKKIRNSQIPVPTTPKEPGALNPQVLKAMEENNQQEVIEDTKLNQSAVDKAVQKYKEFIEETEQVQIEKTVDEVPKDSTEDEEPPTSIEIPSSGTGGNALLPILFENQMNPDIQSNGESLQKLLQHGCWCSILDPFVKKLVEKGRPIDELDRACRS